MFKVIVIVNCNYAGCESEEDDWEFETIEEAHKFIAKFDGDTLWQYAIDTIAPEAHLVIRDEDDEDIE